MIAEVRLLEVPYHLDRPFDYLCGDNVGVGSLVRVPFGRADKLRLGVVVALKESSDGKNLKPVHSLLDGLLRLTEQMCGLCLFLKEYTLCTFGEAVKCILPPGALTERIAPSVSKTVSLAIPREAAATLLVATGRSGIRSEGQRQIIRYLIDNGEADAQLVRTLPSVTAANVKALADRGVISISEHERIRNPYASLARERDTEPIVLSRAQSAAYAAIEELYLCREAK